MRSTRGIATLVAMLAGFAMLVAGPVMLVKGFQAQSQIRGELSAQQIVFPASEAKGLPKAQSQYAGQQVKTGVQARAYGDMVEIHVREATGGLSYSQVSSKWIAGGRTDAKLGTLRQTAFMGESLRGSLMGAYQAWELTWLVIGLGLLVGTLGVAFISIAVATRPVRITVPESPEALRHHKALHS
jgi:hypothetical protein